MCLRRPRLWRIARGVIRHETPLSVGASEARCRIESLLSPAMCQDDNDESCHKKAQQRRADKKSEQRTKRLDGDFYGSTLIVAHVVLIMRWAKRVFMSVERLSPSRKLNPSLMLSEIAV